MQTSVNPAQPAAAEEEAIDLRAHLVTLSDGKWIILIAALLGLLGGWYVAFVAPRIYQVDALVQVESQNTGNNAAIGDLAQAFDNKSPVNGEIEIITSRMVLGQVVDQLSLTTHAEPLYFPRVGRAAARGFTASQQAPVAPARFGLHEYAWGGERIVLTRLELPPSLAGQALTLKAGASGAYQLTTARGSVLGQGQVGKLLTLGQGEQRLQVFIQELQARPATKFLLYATSRNAEISRIAGGLKVVEKVPGSGMLRLTLTGTEPAQIRTVLQAIATTYQRQNVERKSAEAQATLSFLEARLPEIRRNVDAAEDALNAFRLRAGSVDLTKETDLILQESVTLEQSRLELEQKRREALQRFTANHPSVQTLDAQIARISGNIGRVAGEAKNLPETQQELLRLTRDVKVNTDLYTNLLNNSQQLQVVRAGTVGNVRIIDAPEQAIGPIQPQVSKILSVGLLIGLSLGVGLVYLRRFLLAGVEDPAQVEAALGIPTYANVPYARGQAKLQAAISAGNATHALLATAYPNDVTVEALRSLRTALHFAQLDAPNNVVMLTGPSPGLGKSFISLNLAATLAAGGKRVVVVDGDMRRGHMHEAFKQPRGPGLSDVIAGSHALEACLRNTGVDNLQLLTTGTIPPNPSELLLKDQFAHLLKELGQRFDVVLIDTPPVLAVTDAAIVGRLAGTTLLVLKAGEHPLRMIVDTHRRLQSAGVIVRGTLMNQVNSRSDRYSAYGYRYGYYSYEYSSKTK